MSFSNLSKTSIWKFGIRPTGRKKPDPPPRRAASTRGRSEEDKDDVFKKKLRSAVYDALSEKGINEKSQLFRFVYFC